MYLIVRNWVRYLLMFLLLGFVCSWSDMLYAQKGKARFEHKLPTTVRASRSVRIEGRIIGADDLDYAELRYRRMGSKDNFQIIKLQQDKQINYAIIPPDVVQIPGVEFYVVGISFSGKAQLISGSPSAPNQFLVIDEGDGPEPPPHRPPPKRKSVTDTPIDPSPDHKPVPGGPGERLSQAMQTSTPSRRLQGIYQTPVTVTVITAHEIKNYGWRSLIDILRSVAGIDINDRGYSSDIGMRGINPLQNNGNGILFLLDGHDMSWRQLQQNLALASWISVDDIDRIEVIRGPVSGLWGRGSLHGAINIITKSGAGLSGYAGTMGIGLPGGSHFFNLRAGNRFASGLSLYATLSLRNEYRSAVIAPIFEFINTPANLTYISPDDRNLGQDFYFKADWNGLFLTVHQSRFDATAPLNQYALIGGDETRFVTDRIIARLGWQGTIGKWAHLQVWAAFDRMSFASDTSVTFNPLSKNTSSPKSAGMSDTYLLTRRKVDGEGKEQIETLYAPSCEILSSPETAKSACVRLGMVEYQDNENKTQRTAACVLVENRDVKPTTGAQKVSLEERYQTWFPSADCQRIYSDGSHRQPLRAEDNRIEIGTQLSLAFLEWLHLMAGLQFEYLQSTLWHFTNFWESQIAGQNIESELPNYANIRFGAYLQAQAKIGHWGMVSAAGRLDIDERLGARFSPQIGAVVTPGFDLFIKLNYALGSRAASLYEQFFYEQNRYGNPGLLDEEVHTISLQVGWLRRELVYVALSGFFSIYNNPIISQSVGNNQPVANAEKFIYPTPNPSGTYHQLINRENGYTSLGGEIEARLFPLYGFEARAFFGIALATEVINEQGDADRMPYSAGLYSGLEATYRYEFFRASLGLLYTGSKIAPVTSFDIKGNLPVRGLVDADQAKPIPNWSANSHPRAPSVEEIPRAEGYIKLHITIQFLNLFKHFDLSLRAQNILFMGDAYDAGNPLLYPQKRFEFLAWLNFHY